MKSISTIPRSHTRRQFVAQSAAAGATLVLSPLSGLAGGAAGDPQPTAVKHGSIDAHVHVWTSDVEKYPLAPGFRQNEVKPSHFTPEDLFAHCQPCGVTRIVLIQMSFYGYDNSYMLDMMRQHSGVFSGVAVVDPQAQPAHTMRRFAMQGVRGFRIHPRGLKEDEWLAGPGMAEMWKAGAADRLAMCCLIDARYLPSVDAMCRQYGDTPVVIDHVARIGVDGQIRKSDVNNLCALARHKHAYVKISAFYALGHKRAPYTDLGPLIRRVVDAFGPDRCMWASDCPFQVEAGHEYRPSIELIRSGLDFLSDNDRQWLLGKTAESVFF
jgi:predicted TIM-barrel fold metal-dependent hydrolase